MQEWGADGVAIEAVHGTVFRYRLGHARKLS